jgi:hypothetical protein
VRTQQHSAQPRVRYRFAYAGSVSFAVNSPGSGITTNNYEHSFATAFSQVPGVAFSTSQITQLCSPSTSTRHLWVSGPSTPRTSRRRNLTSLSNTSLPHGHPSKSVSSPALDPTWSWVPSTQVHCYLCRSRFSQNRFRSSLRHLRQTHRQPCQLDRTCLHHRLHCQKRQRNFHPRLRQVSLSQ